MPIILLSKAHLAHLAHLWGNASRSKTYEDARLGVLST